ncbi:MAG: repeat protein [Gemmataceae bacterium]|nr:repeat protein [Gemmataceae bacterium]
MFRRTKRAVGLGLFAALTIAVVCFFVFRSLTPPDVAVSGPPPADTPPPPPPFPPAALILAPIDLADGASFLYSGPQPRQTGVDPRALPRDRVAVLRGRVFAADAQPTDRVAVSVQRCPELGSTTTGPDGVFDLAVRGGEPLVVVYQKPGCLPAFRSVTPLVQDYTWLPDVTLLPPDPQATTIDLAADAPFQVVRASRVGDRDGTRRATLLVPRGTKAEMLLRSAGPAGGERQPVARPSIRLTEYSVGPRGPSAMPAPLPPTSAYTYAVELSVDEVVDRGVKVGGKDLLLSQPVYFYVENFLRFPAGTAVPAGYYDNDRAAWVPAPGGRSVTVLAVRDSLAELDVDGVGRPADAGRLAALGISDDERRQLGSEYAPGQGLWRVPLTHFSTYDLNWGAAPPGDATPPGQGPGAGGPNEDPCVKNGSIIEIQNQGLGESVPLAGTSLGLHYSSTRVPGRTAAYTLDLPLSGPDVPKSLRRIELEVVVAGQRLQKTFPPGPNQRFTFTWDGKDAYGRHVPAQRPATVRIGYVYGAVYEQTPAFAAPATGTPVTGDAARQEYTFWQEGRYPLGVWDARLQHLAGWTLTAHHGYDPIQGTLYRGDGLTRRQAGLDAVLHPLVGPAPAAPSAPRPTFPLALNRMSGFARAADGSLYVTGGWEHQVRRIRPDGQVTIVAGTGQAGFSGDGGPATQARLNTPTGLAVGPDGSLYVGDHLNFRIRRVSPDGRITTVVGAADPGKRWAEGVPATEAYLWDGFEGFVVGPDGSLYLPESRTVRRVGTDGVITTWAGDHNEPGAAVGDGGPAARARFDGLTCVALGPDGTLYLAESVHHRVRCIRPDGRVLTVAGTGQAGFSGDGGPAAQARLDSPRGLTVGPDGSLYVIDSGNGRIRRVTSDGLIVTVAGTGKTPQERLQDRDGGRGPAPRDTDLALEGTVDLQAAMAIDERGRLLFSEPVKGCLWHLRPAFEGLPTGETAVPTADGAALDVFNQRGQHLRTVDAVSGRTVLQFAYDGEGRLESVADDHGNRLRVERDAQGRLVAVVAPHGQRTELLAGENGYPGRVGYPGGAVVELTYGAGGLLTAFRAPGGAVSRFHYAPDGLLVRDEHPDGGATTLERSPLPNGFEVFERTTLRRASPYRIERLRTGEVVRTNVCCCGGETRTVLAPDGTQTLTVPDGTVLTRRERPDPRWGLQAPLIGLLTATTPGRRTLRVETERTVRLIDPADPLRPAELTEIVRVNGRASTRTFQAADRRVTSRSPAGRQQVMLLDERHRLSRLERPGELPVEFAHDDEGRLTGVRQGEGPAARALALRYDARGRLAAFTDPVGRISSREYDEADRPVREALPGGRVVNYRYDAAGRLAAVQPPGRPAHTFGYTPGGLPEFYQPPGGKPTRFKYDADRRPTRVERADGSVVELKYDPVGHLESLTYPGGTVGYQWDAKTGQLRDLTAEGQALRFRHDGFLVTEIEADGLVKGRIRHAYGADLRPTSYTVNDDPPVTFAFDDDGLPTRVGQIALQRDAATGRVSATTLGGVTTSQEWGRFGEPQRVAVTAQGKPVYAARYERDALGRITRLDETVLGQTATLAYEYEPAGRLGDVRQGGKLVAHYEYGPNGNRLLYRGPEGEVRGQTDDQDRLLRYGPATWTYADTGEWASKVVDGKTTTYVYDALGSLRSVALPDGTRVEYVLDPDGRRIGRRVNGRLVQAWLQHVGQAPALELDGDGQVVSRFVYATRGHVPDYLERGGRSYRVVTDHRGSVRLVVDAATGEVAQRLDYDPFGRVLRDTSPGFQPFGYGGGLYDPATGLVRFGARDYDPETGRWTAPEPLGFAGGDTNLYAYAANDPVNGRDVNGLNVAKEVWWIVKRFPSPTGPGGKNVPKLGHITRLGEGAAGRAAAKAESMKGVDVGSNEWKHAKELAEEISRDIGGPGTADVHAAHPKLRHGEIPHLHSNTKGGGHRNPHIYHDNKLTGVSPPSGGGLGDCDDSELWEGLFDALLPPGFVETLGEIDPGLQQQWFPHTAPGPGPGAWY